MARLIFRSDAGEEMEYPLGEHSPNVVIGRHKSCGIRTRNNTVSRRHAEIKFVEGGSYHLVDLKSSNGTFYESQRIGEKWLDDGDLFQCGAFEVRFQLDDYEKYEVAEPVEDDSSIIPGIPEASEVFGEELPADFAEFADDEEGISFGQLDAEEPYLGEPVDGPAVPKAAPPADFFSPPAGDAFFAGQPEPDLSFPEPLPADALGGMDDGRAPAIPDVLSGGPFNMEPTLPPTRSPFAPGGVAGEGDAGDIPHTQLPFEPPSFDEMTKAIEATRGPAPPAAGNASFDEFNRQLELKDEQLAELRDTLKARDDDLDLVRTQVDALEKALEEHNRDGASTAEFTAVTAENEGLKAELEGLRDENADTEERLRALETQILRIQDGQPTERELAELRDAKVERDRLWESREKLESTIIQLKKEAQEVRDGTAVAESEQVERLRDQIAELESSVEAAQQFQQDAEDKLAETDNRLADAEEKLQESQDEIAVLENRLDDAPDADELTRMEGKLEKLRTKNAELRRELDELAGEREQLREMASDRTEQEAAERKAASLEKRIQLLEEELEDSQKAGSEASALAAERASLNAELESTVAELKDMLAGMPDEDQVQTLESAKNKAEREREDLLSEIDQVKEALADAEQTLKDGESRSARETRRLEKALAKAETARDKFDGERVALKAKLDELEEVLVHAPSRTQFEDLKSRLTSIEKERDAVASKADRESDKARDLAEQLDTAKKAQKESKDALAALKEEARAAAKSVKDAERDARKTAKASESLKTHVADLEDEIEAARATLAEEKARAAELAALAKDAEKIGDLEAELDKAQADLAASKEGLDKTQADLKAVRRELKAAQKSAGDADALNEELELLTEERDDLLLANKGNMKRISSLLKTVDSLEAAAAAAAKSDVSSDRVEDLEAELDELGVERDKLAHEVEELSSDLRGLEATVKRLEADLEDARSAGTDLDGAERELSRLRDINSELTDRVTEIEGELEKASSSVGGDLASSSKSEAMVESLRSLLEDLNDLVSQFGSNNDTVEFCIDDLEKSVGDATDHYAAARDMISENGQALDVIKQRMKRFRREFLN